LLLRFDAQQVVSTQPVLVRWGNNEMRGAAMRYDHATRRLDVTGPLRVTLPPRARAGTR
jgi:hypothetical protein